MEAIMSENLTQASSEWANRPADQRYASLQAMHIACIAAANNAQETTADLKRSEVVVTDKGGLALQTPHQGRLTMSHWSFGQFCNMIQSSAKYIRSLVKEPERAAHNLNRDIARSDRKTAELYINGSGKTLSCTSESYARVFNHAIVGELRKLPDFWKTPPARPCGENVPGARIATEADVVRSSLIKPGEMIAPAGLYASDEDMFAFMIDDATRIDDGTDGGLSRGFFVANSEVGKRRFDVTMFLYRYVCGNHIVWEAENVKQIRIKHMGREAETRCLDAIRNDIQNYAKVELGGIEARIKRAKNLVLGNSLEDLSDRVYDLDIGLTRKAIENAYGLAEANVSMDGSPRTCWGFAQGLTRYSQFTAYADQRETLDQAAAKVLKLAD
jgi:hypothetical protein